MGVVIESEIWEPNKLIFLFLFISCVLSIFCLPIKAVANVFDHAPPASFLRFQRKFLLVYSLSSVMEGLWAVFGEYELAYYGFSKEQMLTFLSIGFAISMFIGSFLGILSDVIGHKKMCLLFYMMHLFVSIWKIFVGTPMIWLASIILSLASSIFSFSFETWMVVEHDKLGQRQDLLNDMFWLMTFSESASFISSQVIANYLIDGNLNKNIKSIWNGAAVFAVIAIIYVTRGWQEAPKTADLKQYHISIHRHAICDKRIWLLSWAQACVQFSVAAFWVLWAPTIVDIGVLVALFCLFQTCTGVAMPSLARLRTMYVPNEIRGGIMSLSLMPANAAVLFLLVLRSRYQCIGNSSIISFAAFGLFSAAGCMYFLRKWGKQLDRSRHNL